MTILKFVCRICSAILCVGMLGSCKKTSTSTRTQVVMGEHNQCQVEDHIFLDCSLRTWIDGTRNTPNSTINFGIEASSNEAERLKLAAPIVEIFCGTVFGDREMNVTLPMPMFKGNAESTSSLSVISISLPDLAKGGKIVEGNHLFTLRIKSNNSVFERKFDVILRNYRS